MKKILIISTIIAIAHSLFAQTPLPFTNNNDIPNAINLCYDSSATSNKFTQFGNSFTVTTLNGVGSIPNEISFSTSNIKETHSAWYTFTIAKAGKLKMEIKPLEGRTDDIDFILEKYNLNVWQQIRVSLNGPNINRLSTQLYCNGSSTGLRDIDVNTPPVPPATTPSAENLTPELDGCIATNLTNSNGYLLTLDVLKNEKYRLFVNNWYTNDGFTMSFSNNSTSCKFTSCRVSTQNGSKISSNGNNKNPNEISNSELLIAPNPTNAIFTATYEQTEKENAIFELYDYSGRLLEIQKSDEEQYRHTISFDLNNKPNGLYYLKVKTQSNQISKPIVKQ